jgi:hypothetical protein
VAGTIGKRLSEKKSTQFKIVGIVVAFIRGIAASKDEHLVLLDFASRMKSASEGDISRTLLESPFHSLVVDNAESIEVAFGEKILGIVELFRLLKSAEQVMSLADGNHGVARAGRRDVACLLDLLPGDRGRLNRPRITIQTGEIK